MTERLYYTDAYQRTFTATVTAIAPIAGQHALILDRSSFYPTSGGQAYDTGQLGPFTVTDVIVGDDGQVYHVIAEEATPAIVGQTLEGTIDWPRRYDHMQQHAGQHLLSQLFYQHFGYETVAVHFGATESTLDLAIAELAAAQLDAVEVAANRLVYEALPIHAYFMEESTLHTIPLRRPPKVQGQIRIVEIERFDYSACGGTHCRTTAEIGPVKLTKSERRRGQVRVTFLCGGRAYQDYATKHRLLSEAALLFGNEFGQVPTLIERALGQLRDSQRLNETLQAALLHYEAAALYQQATRHNDYRVVSAIFTDKPLALVKILAGQLQAYEQTVALLGVQEGDKASLCFACTPALTTLHMGNLLRTVLQASGGKGGGRADFAQGGGIAATQLEAALQLAHTQLTST